MCTEKGCSVSVHTTLNKELICLNGVHNHLSSPEQLEAKLVRNKMKKRILTETIPITKIYDEEIVKAKLSKSAAAILPTVIEYRSNMSKTRRKITSVIPSTVMIEIPELYQQTLSNERFLTIDLFLKRGQDRILVFASNQQLELLFEFCMEDLRVAFCVLPNKRGKTYTALMEQLKEQVNIVGKQFNPKRFVTDYEPGLMPILEQEFPKALHSDCMFHFNQVIHRKITAFGLSSDYLHNESIRDQCRQLMASSLTPIDEVKNQFKRLQTIMSTLLGDLLLYFKHQWMYGVVPIEMWNFHNVDHRTNNTSETYNLRFATRLSRKHPNVWSFIQLIQCEHVRFEHTLIQRDAGASIPKQSKKKTKAFQMKFNNLKERFLKKELNCNQLVTGVSLLIGNKKNSISLTTYHRHFIFH
ncbi:unnamed protein product [Rotaria socialis]|uniref:MULE transposase domain-containing protein n=1 Tax=Rotaria socialis TaxID=392032 RepID=A0A818IFX9_9BILA|nr:unnamed protein product [Rotaria socialis]CAF4581064.1 unnamed protein product [Rotaria socialis]